MPPRVKESSWHFWCVFYKECLLNKPGRLTQDPLIPAYIFVKETLKTPARKQVWVNPSPWKKKTPKTSQTKFGDVHSDFFRTNPLVVARGTVGQCPSQQGLWLSCPSSSLAQQNRMLCPHRFAELCGCLGWPPSFLLSPTDCQHATFLRRPWDLGSSTSLTAEYPTPLRQHWRENLQRWAGIFDQNWLKLISLSFFPIFLYCNVFSFKGHQYLCRWGGAALGWCWP